MKKKLILVLLMLILPCLFAVHVGADEVPAVLTVDGDELMIDTVNEISTFIGNVHAQYETFQILGQKLIYDQQKQYARIEGAVRMTGEEMQVQAEVIEVNLVTEFVTMSGNVEVTRQGQLIKGAMVTYDMTTKTLRVKSAHLEITETNK